MFMHQDQTMCENIPQVIIQILYLTQSAKSSNSYANDKSFVIVLSLGFSVISILSQIVMFLVELNNILVEYNKHVTYITNFEIKMTLHSPHFKSQHQFIHNKIERVLRNSFLKCSVIGDLMNRKDITLKHCVYYIDTSNLKSKRKIKICDST